MTRIALLSSIVLGATGLSAQAPAAPELQGPVPVAGDRRIAVHDHGGDPEYGTWAAGDAYKVRFANGATFYPQLGRDYPHDQPFGWRTTSVRIGEHELLVPGKPPAMAHTDYRVTFDHGAVTEQYDVLAEGLEQSFVLARRPAGPGDLCITGALTTALTTTPVQDVVGPLSFRDANGVEILRYGRAVAIDADGDQFAVTTTCVGGTITLRLAASDLASAHFPLVVDPLQVATYVDYIGPVAAVGETDCGTETDHLAANSVMGYTRWFSATDSDIVTRIGAVTLVAGSNEYVDLSAAASADHARLAFVPATNHWVVVYQNLITATQQMQLRAAMFDGGTTAGTATNSVPHLVASGTHEWRPCVGGLAAGASTKVLVTYQQENGTAAFANTATSRVMGVLFDTATASGTWGVPFQVYGSASEDAERPSVNRRAEGGNAFSWFVVCQAFTNNAGNDDWDLIGKLVTNTGAVSAGQWISSLGTTHKLGPVVDGSGGRYCVLFSTASTSIGKNQDVVGNDIRCERLNWAHGAAAQDASGDWPVQTLATNAVRILEATGIACDLATLSHWYPVWRSSSTAPACYGTRVGYRGAALQSAELIASTGASTPGAASALYNEALHIGTFCYMLASGFGELWTRAYPALNPLGISTLGSVCSSAHLGWAGPSAQLYESQQIGCELSMVTVTNAPAGSLHLTLVATATTDVVPGVAPFAPSCHLLVPFGTADYLGMLPLGVGAQVAWPLALPEYLPAMTLSFQDWILDPADNLLHGSNRVTVPLVK